MRIAKGLALLTFAATALPTLPAQAQEACGMFPQGVAEHVCTCTGAESGAVWGSDPYTSDSDICTAARHAGVIASDGGVVNVLPDAGREAYPASLANGVQTSDWGAYPTSFTFRPVEHMLEACGALRDGVNEFTCACTGQEAGAVWGSGPYTSDSDICTAALHAGVIGAQGGAVTVYRLRGLQAYPASANNGVMTMEWGAYGTSIDFGPIPMPPAAPALSK